MEHSSSPQTRLFAVANTTFTIYFNLGTFKKPISLLLGKITNIY